MQFYKLKKSINDKNFCLSSIESGFTLAEIVVSLAVFSLVLIAISFFARNVFYFGNIFSGGLNAYDESKKVLQPIASEIRSASPSSLGAYPIEATQTTNFVFFSDINNDGLKEKIRYFMSGNNLMKGVIIPTGNPLQYLSGNESLSQIASGVRNGGTPIFTYYDTNYDGSNSPLSQPVSSLNVRLVKITLIIDVDPNRPPSPVTITTQVSLRNLKDNL